MKRHAWLKVGYEKNEYRKNIKCRIYLTGCFTKSKPNVQRNPIVMITFPAETHPFYHLLILTNPFIQKYLKAPKNPDWA